MIEVEVSNKGFQMTEVKMNKWWWALTIGLVVVFVFDAFAAWFGDKDGMEGFLWLMLAAYWAMYRATEYQYEQSRVLIEDLFDHNADILRFASDVLNGAIRNGAVKSYTIDGETFEVDPKWEVS